MSIKSFARMAATGSALAMVAMTTLASSAFAQTQTEAVNAAPVNGQFGFLPSGSEMNSKLVWFHDFFLLPIIIVISLFVLGLILFVIFRFNEKANPVPSRVTHNSTVEVVWTVVPILILVAIAIPAFRLLSEQVRIPQVVDMKNAAGEALKDAAGNPAQGILVGGQTNIADAKPIGRVINLKVTGNQWNWTINYAKDSGAIEFTAIMLTDDQIKDKTRTPRLLSVDNEAVVPVNAFVRVQVTASDTLHSFTLPSFGFKVDAVRGRLNETWFRPEKIGVYYGQCSELCGKDHAFMPVVFRVVTEEQYVKWLAKAQANQEAGKGPGNAEEYMIASINEKKKLAAQ
jgi:cytochrome c oxidase subunit II